LCQRSLGSIVLLVPPIQRCLGALQSPLFAANFHCMTLGLSPILKHFLDLSAAIIDLSEFTLYFQRRASR